MQYVKQWFNHKNKSKMLFSFALCSGLMLLLCIYNQYRFEISSSLIAGDMQNLYVPAIQSFVRNLYSGEGLGYSWDLFLGMDTSAYYFSVMGGSVINLLYLLIPFMEAETFVWCAIILKTGIIGLGFTWFGQRVLKVDGRLACVCSVLYAFCGFQVCYNMINYIWMDLLYLLPMLLVAIHSFLEKGKWTGLVLLYAYSFACCFYIAYIVGFVTAIYFLGYAIVRKWTKKIKWQETLGKVFFYGICVMCSAGLLAVFLLPTAYFLLHKGAADATTASMFSLQKNVFVVLSRFAFGVEFDSTKVQPYLYCGVCSILFLPFFFLNKGIALAEKLLYGLLFFLLFVSCFYMPLYLFWHGFDAPDGWDYRFAFVLSFLGIVMSCKAIGTMKEIAVRQYILVCLGELLLEGGILLYVTIVCKEMSFVQLLENEGFLLAWSICGYLFFYSKLGKFRFIQCCCALLLIVEVMTNAVIVHRVYQPMNEMEVFQQEMKDARELLRTDTDFYRVNTENSLYTNADTSIGYRGISDFGTFENYEVRRSLGQLGAYMSPRQMTGYGLNPLTQMLLGVKYNIRVSGSDNFQDAGATVSTYDRFLGLGFLVDEAAQEVDISSGNVFENCNSLASAMVGQEEKIFTALSSEEIQIEEGGIQLRQEEIGYSLERTEDSGDVAQIAYYTPDRGKEVYGVFSCFVIGHLPYRPRIYNMTNDRDQGVFGMKYTKKLDQWADKLLYIIYMEKGLTTDSDQYEYNMFYEANEEVLDEVYTSLKDKTFSVQKFSNGYVKGSIEVNRSDQILYLSIPYDQGWKLSVTDFSGQGAAEAEIVPLLDHAFIGVRFSETGKYIIELTYESPIQKWGILISGISLLGLLAGTVFSRKQKNEESKFMNKG